MIRLRFDDDFEDKIQCAKPIYAINLSNNTSVDLRKKYLLTVNDMFNTQYLCWDDIRINSLKENLKADLEKYKNIIDNIIKNQINNPINQMIRDMFNKLARRRRLTIGFIPNNQGFGIDFNPFYAKFPSVQDYIEFYSLIKPLIENTKILNFFNYCSHCHKYFISESKQVKYCSDNCRKMAFKLKKKN